MKHLSINEIIDATDGTLLSGDDERIVKGISTDSRDIGPEDMFFALTGEKFDGHDYIEGVISSGCKVIVVSKDIGSPQPAQVSFIRVDDTLKAYQNLAKYYKKLIAPITIGITGSVGKTSLKDMLYTIANDHYNTVCSHENENNHIGVPKTIFRMEENTEFLILEMGMNHEGEISLLADIGRPDTACITNIGMTHVENFPDQNGIFQAKMEITDFFTNENTLVINGDDPFLQTIENDKRYDIITAGESVTNDYVAEDARYLDDTHITFLIEYDKGVERFTLPVAGLYNSTTAALAAAALSKHHISVTSCVHSLKKLKVTPHRLQLLIADGIKIIDDTYNASPVSMKSAIEYLMSIDADRKIAVLADMKELGDEEVRLHRETGEMVASSKVDYLFTVGDLGKEIAEAAMAKMGRDRVFPFTEREECSDAVKKFMKKGDGILVKGSNTMEMVKTVDDILK